MIIETRLKEIPLPEIFRREGKDCYYDTYRKKLIEITSEETVRQRIAKLFEMDYGVPGDMIYLEVPMSYYVEGAAGRADIVIHAYDEETDSIYPILIIECKNEDVFLTDKVVDQAIGYCDTLGGKYIAVTNGIEIRFAAYDENSYVFLDEILPYGKMLNMDYVLPEGKKEKLVRFTIEELQDQDLIKEYNDEGSWIFGSDSVPMIRSFAVNMYQALLDTEHKLPPMKCSSFEMIEDLGLRFMDYGNAGGGHYVSSYRSFLVNDRFFETQIVSLQIFGTDPDFRGENRGSYTSLVVSIDRFKTSHNSLQYNIDRYAKVKPDGHIEFLHNGQISGIKSSEVLNRVLTYGDGLKVDGNKINLGTVRYDKLLYLDDHDVSGFVYNLIEYAFLREEVRKKLKR